MSHSSPRRISVIGAGGWGTALALLAAHDGSEVILWGHNPEHVEEMKSTRMNAAYLAGVTLPKNVRPTASLSECLESEVLFFVVPSKFLREVATALAATGSGLHPASVMISCTKGIEHSSGKLMSDILSEVFPHVPMAVLSGPNLAGEIARGIPAAGVIGCEHEELLPRLQEIFVGTGYRAYSSDDLRGIQLGGALKNVFAISAGVSDGFGMGENAKSGLVTRSLAEMTRLGVAMGGHRETFRGLSGIGDLMVTCFSRQSRNRQVGERLSRGESPLDIQSSMTMVAEGMLTSRSAHECAKKLGVETPIIDEVHAVLYEGKSPAEAMRKLLEREMRQEEEEKEGRET